MTRDEDRFVPLGERVKIAREAGADLFISIHADSLTQAQDVRGATVYTGSERATDAEAARLAAKENQSDTVAGLDSSEDTQDVAGILMDLAKRETRTFSSVFARNLVETLGGSVKMHKVPLRSAGFRVLSAPDVPSVLIELGYMSSPKDAELLNSAAWRTQAVAAVHAAVDGYFAQARLPAGKAAENRR
jgi:N-acetylmuramoyl-L-alanine amidase